MNDEIFESVERYIDDLFAPGDAALDAALQSMKDAGLPEIQVAPGHGQFLYLLAKTCGAERILEIGTLGGYSTIWLARALPETGRLITLERDPAYAEVARANIERAGLSDRVEIRVGAALDSLAELADEEENARPFDVVFLDADKVNNVKYLRWAQARTRPGSLILADNVIRRGTVLEPGADDASARGAAEFNAALAADPTIEAIILQQVGSKGHDGLAVARVCS